MSEHGVDDEHLGTADLMAASEAMTPYRTMISLSPIIGVSSTQSHSAASHQRELV